MSIYQNKKNKGFTIVESLVAITVLILAITGVSGAIQKSISAYTFSRDQVIAFYLAQEGFEQIRNMRDENVLSGRNWLTGIAAASGNPCYFGNACYVEPIASNVAVRCSAPGNCPDIRQNATTFFFGYDSTWSLTKFRRNIALTSINANEISVVVTITWTEGTSNKQFTARENLLNWQ